MLETKQRDWTISLLLGICAGLIFYGAFGGSYCWFTGAGVVMLMSLGSMYAYLVRANGNTAAPTMLYGGAALALVAGAHLLMPYFWGVRVEPRLLVSAFAITSAFLWIYLQLQLRAVAKPSKLYLLFTLFPLVILTGCFMSVRMMTGTLYAAGLLEFYYVLLGVALAQQGWQAKVRWRLLAGVLLLCAVAVGFSLSFLFTFPLALLFGIIVILLVVNLLFNRHKG